METKRPWYGLELHVFHLEGISLARASFLNFKKVFLRVQAVLMNKYIKIKQTATFNSLVLFKCFAMYALLVGLYVSINHCTSFHFFLILKRNGG